MERISPSSTPNWKHTPEYYDVAERTLDIGLEEIAAYRTWKDLDPGPGHDIDSRFAALPALTKKDIRENFPHGMLPSGCDLDQGIKNGEITLVETSGTTDDTITNIWNQKWWDASERASWKLNSYMSRIATGSHNEAILSNPINVGIISDEIDLPMEDRRLARFLYLNEKTDPVAWTPTIMERMIQELNTFQPAVLEANPSYLARLCRYMNDRHKTVFQPGAIVFTYEYTSHFCFRQIRSIFPSVPMISSYGTTETGYVFMQCENGKLHQNSEYSRVDFQPFRREHGGPLLGRILVTPLNNHWSYLLRFDTGDIVQLEASGKCDCGRNSGLILSSLNGRRASLTLTCGGRLVTLNELDNALCVLHGIEEYELVQTDGSAYDLHLVSQRPDKEKLSEHATRILKKLYGQEAKVSIVYRAAIAPERSGKYLISRALFPIELEKYLA
jgi:phenylacetate-coenzyme A ligase PaaK-like adenylate-forming protein